MLPTEEFWPIPEDDWTVVDRSHGKPRSNNSSNRGRAHNPGGKLDSIGLRYEPGNSRGFSIRTQIRDDHSGHRTGTPWPGA